MLRERDSFETDLHERIRRGDGEAFEQLFRGYYATLCRFAGRYTTSPAVAEELVQDLFTRIWIERARWPAPQNIRAYLFGAVRNRALNVKNRQRVERDWEAEEQLADVADSTDPQRELESSESASRLARAIARLPERCRMVIHLRWMEQHSYAEIAEIMGISVKGVENQLARGLRALRSYMGDRA